MQPSELPHRLEGGTPNVFGIAGLREGVRLLLERGVDNVLAHERSLISEFYRALRDPGLFSWYGADWAISSVRSKAVSALWESIFPDLHLLKWRPYSTKGSISQFGQGCIALLTRINISVLFRRLRAF